MAGGSRRGPAWRLWSMAMVLATPMGACASGTGAQVTEKLDPNLKARIEALAVGAGAAGGGIEASDMVEVLIGLDGPASDAELAALKTAGLSVRSIMGDVLTGTIPAGQVAGVAAHRKVVKIEASGALQMERPPTD